ncbi:hypothetical protein ACWEVP_35820 [Amycolatopsis sp. NPDC003865]
MYILAPANQTSTMVEMYGGAVCSLKCARLTAAVCPHYTTAGSPTLIYAVPRHERVDLVGCDLANDDEYDIAGLAPAGSVSTGRSPDDTTGTSGAAGTATSRSAATQAPTSPATFRWRDCRGDLKHDPELHDQLVCTNPQCFAAGSPVALWRAQRARVRRGDDRPAPGPGWPRPLVQGRPHPWVTPVSNGTPWWRLLDGARQALAQDAWLCQVCGEPLPTRALVVLDGDRVVSDTGLHPRCLAVADAVCPHLTRAATRYTYAEVTRLDLLADGRPLPPPQPDATEDDDIPWVPAWTAPAYSAGDGRHGQ